MAEPFDDGDGTDFGPTLTIRVQPTLLNPLPLSVTVEPAGPCCCPRLWLDPGGTTLTLFTTGCGHNAVAPARLATSGSSAALTPTAAAPPTPRLTRAPPQPSPWTPAP